ncbi:MAG: nicotinate-nucleotide adenylyltransferase [Lachnospiraceae bacterium]|nr:nicotinate-nucleotide adenylyltransferase [Lachnospiraceae bacterium]
MSKIGFFGGTFNPIHNAHLRIAQEAKDRFGLDRILLVPSGYSWMKDPKEIASREDRLRMAELAAEECEGFEVSTIETNQEGPTYSYETLQKLKALYPEDEICFIIGADQLMILEQWKKPEEIFRLATILVADRGGFDRQEMEEKAAELTERYGAKIRIYHMEASELSSTELRRRIRDGEDISGCVPEKVAEYVEKKELYR